MTMKELSLIDKAFLLKKSPLFSTIDVDILLGIADKFESEHYKKGSKIFECDQDAGRIYLIHSGSVVVKNRQGATLAELRAPEIFGEEGVFSGKKRGYDALSETDVSLLTLSHTHLMAILRECPETAISLLEAFSSVTDFRKR